MSIAESLINCDNTSLTLDELLRLTFLKSSDGFGALNTIGTSSTPTPEDVRLRPDGSNRERPDGTNLLRP